jgi:hypothetical protein
MSNGTRPSCSVAGCEKPARSGSAAHCTMHYHRLYRHGSLERSAVGSGITVSKGRRYKAHFNRTHPLAPPSGRIYRHREVLYDAIGAGPHPCHWCGVELTWSVDPRGSQTEIVVDHLNGIGDDNRPENLVPSCARCNSGRAIQARSVALREAGWWSVHDTINEAPSLSRAAPIEVTRGA